MVYNIIPLIIIIISLAIIIFVIVRKFPAIAAIDTSTIASEKHEVVKRKIVAEKLKRNLKEKTSFIGAGLKPVFVWLGKIFQRFYKKIVELERHYQRESKKAMGKGEVVRHVEEIIKEAKELARQEKLEEAEQKYVEAIGLDAKNIEAYKALGDIYFEKKEYDQAKETFEHVLKLEPEDDEIYLDLGLVFQALGEHKESLGHFKEAVKLAPNDPKNLDILLEESIMIGNKSLAEKTLRQLKKVNPDNQKLEEFQERIKQL